MARHVLQHLVAGDAGIVHHDVGTAEPGQFLGDAARRVRRGNVQRQAQAVEGGQGLAQHALFLRPVDADHARAFARQGGGDGGTDAARRAGDHRNLAAQRQGEILQRPGRGERRRQRQHLTGDEGGVLAEEETQRTGQQCVGVAAQLEQVDGDALLADLLAQGADEAAQGLAGGAGRRILDLFRRARQQQHAAAARDAADARLVEVIQLAQAGRPLEAAGVEHVGPGAGLLVLRTRLALQGDAGGRGGLFDRRQTRMRRHDLDHGTGLV